MLFGRLGVGVRARTECSTAQDGLITIPFEILRRFTRCFSCRNHDGTLSTGFRVEISRFTNAPYINFCGFVMVFEI